MSGALMYLGASLFILVTLVVLFRIEDAYGDRIILNRARAAGDRLLAAGKVQKGAVVQSGSLNYVRITWHYLVHTLLKRLLAALRRLQVRVEQSLQKNKAAARELQSGGGDAHLSAIAAHKEKMTLSHAEREKRRAH